MKIIAHKIENIPQAKKALAAGANFVEIDVAKRIIFTKFTTQHHGIKGKFGIGENLESILSAVPPYKLLLDIKHANLSFTFVKKLSGLLTVNNIKNARICGRDWQIISQICQKTTCLPFYTISTAGDVRKLKILLSKLASPAGFSVRRNLVDEELIRDLKSLPRGKTDNFPTSKLWAWTVNEIKEAKRLQKLGVDGIITDEWEKLKGN